MAPSQTTTTWCHSSGSSGAFEETLGSQLTAGLPTWTKNDSIPPSEGLSIRRRYSSFLATTMRERSSRAASAEGLIQAEMLSWVASLSCLRQLTRTPEVGEEKLNAPPTLPATHCGERTMPLWAKEDASAAR